MSSTRITDQTIKALKPVENKQIEICDNVVKGLRLRASPRGTKSFSLLYRFNGKPRRLGIGRYGIISLGDARRRAKQILYEVAMGRDPAAERVTRRLQLETHLFVVLLDEYIEKHASRRNRDWRETRRLLFREFIPKWRNKTVDEISKGHVLKILDDILHRRAPGTANHAFAALRAFMNWAVGVRHHNL